VCTREFFAARRGVGCDRDEPIFIVGLPRAGSTLLEQILASHSQVEGTMELAEIPRLALHLSGREGNTERSRYPAVLAELPPERFREFGEKYLADTQILRTGRPRFIDKMPNNFRHVGLLHLMLPNARSSMPGASRWRVVSATSSNCSPVGKNSRTASMTSAGTTGPTCG